MSFDGDLRFYGANLERHVYPEVLIDCEFHAGLCLPLETLALSHNAVATGRHGLETVEAFVIRDRRSDELLLGHPRRHGARWDGSAARIPHVPDNVSRRRRLPEHRRD